eukprot:CAMPEP_0171096740 /NCGR_PEP_ID=MMETSP0766_2-20121228/45768_1 /TAXON_ID=439317 /ORGANISM="Gambierdiscus australes, Strain CAWD 149" /LENGTH=260 /DNA_ID=CAMNT_0011555791 /DNA_START=57 /DNA_END=839 /DNA_ORIENTATION=+
MAKLQAPLLLGALCAGVIQGACGHSALNASAPDDVTALLQHNLHVQHGHAQAQSSIAAEVSSLFDCGAHPSLCKPPFSCDKVTSEDFQFWAGHSPTAAGKPNYQMWCAFPNHAEYASKCQAGDLDGASKVHFEGAARRHTSEMDASMCFIDGHCVNTAVSNTTTVEEAIRMCDERLGRETWANWGGRGTPVQHRLGYAALTDVSKGFDHREQTLPYLIASCAMGNYHCDVHACQSTYCKDQHYIQKYGHFLETHGWVKAK